LKIDIIILKEEFHMKRICIFVVLVSTLLAQFLTTPSAVHAATISLSIKNETKPGVYYTDGNSTINLYMNASYPSTIVYTTNGTTPKAKMSVKNVLTVTNGKIYYGILKMSSTTTVKAIAILNWYTASPVYTYQYQFVKTAPKGTSGVYYLPWADTSTSYAVSRAGVDHDHAIDFTLPKDLPVYAARSGKIVKIVETNTISGCLAQYSSYANYVAIKDSSTNETAYYVHLKTNSVPDNLVVGTYVTRGTMIGKVGNIGYVCGKNGGYHLHFYVTNSSGTVVDPFFADVQNGFVYTDKSYPNGNILWYKNIP
jgi:murein DD-endopeptidase MepM/ murein hydrolase activator NlpD